MSKMNTISLLLTEYADALNERGHADPIVVVKKRELLNYGLSMINEEVECIDHDFDTMVFNNQCEGRF